MTTLLRVDASARQTGSHSRALGDAFQAAFLARHPGAAILRRDLAAQPVPQIENATIAGFYAPPGTLTDETRAATALSDTLIAELRAADSLLITTPMYNFSVPSALKAWIDQIVRIGHTFAYDGQSFTGLVTGKPAYVACAYGAGGWLDGGQMEAYNLLRSYLRLLLGFLGFTDVQFFGIENTTADPVTVDANAARAHAEIGTVLKAAA